MITFNEAKILVIPKDKFLKIIATRGNANLHEYAHDKMVFLRNRVKYLTETGLKNIRNVLYQDSRVLLEKELASV